MTRQIFEEVSTRLSEAGVLIKEETFRDATIIEASISTKHKKGGRDSEIHQTIKAINGTLGSRPI